MHSQKVTTLTVESIDQYRNWCIARGQSANTAKAYSTDLRMLMGYHGMDSISANQYENLSQIWLNETRQMNAPKTTGRRLTSLRGFAKWARWETDLSEYRAPTPAKTLPHPLPGLTSDLDRLLLVAPNDELKALVGCCGFIGLRVSEALDFRVSWFHAHDKVIRVRGKGDKERVVPVSMKAWEIISPAFVDAMCGDGTLIHYSNRSARKAITTMGKRAGISRSISSHDLRATYATVIANKGAPMRVVQELLGHSSLSTTEIYTGVDLSAMKDAVELL
jgi:integrase/recombinase XerD